MGEERMDMFCHTYNFNNLVKEPTCFKSMENPSCAELILSNIYLYFQHTSVRETGFSNFQKLTVIQMKCTFHKQQPIILNYTNAIILNYTNAIILNYTNAIILNYTNAIILNYTNAIILNYTNAIILNYTTAYNLELHKCYNLELYNSL